MGHAESLIDCTLFSSALIIGKDKNDYRKSNGVGKSSIFKAIDYVLYNVSPTKTLEKIIRDGEKKCLVQFDFELNSSIYRVIRTRSKSGASDLLLKCFENNEWKDITEKTNTETERALHKLIKINYKAFQNSVLFAQGDLDGIAKASPQDRKSLLKEPLQLSIYTKLEKMAKEGASQLSKQVESCATLIDNLGDPKQDISLLKKQIKSLKEEIISNENLRKENQIELDQKRAELLDYQRLITSEIVEVQKNLDNVNDEINNNINNSNKMSRLLKEKELKAKEYESQLKSKTDSLQTLEEKLEKINLISIRKEQDIKNDLEKAIENEHRGRVHISKLEGDLKRYSQPMPEGSECLTCLQEIPSQHKENCERKAKEECEKIRQKIEEYKIKLKSILKKKEAFSSELNEGQQNKLEIQKIKNLIDSNKVDIKKYKEYIQETSNSIKEIALEKSNNDKSLEDLKNRAILLKETIENFSIDDINSKIKATNVLISGLEDKINSSLQKISSLNTNLGISEEKKSAKEKDQLELERLIEKKKGLESEESTFNKVVQAFSSSGIPTLIIHTILDDLQLEANSLLSDLRPGISLQFNISKNDKDTLDLVYLINGKEREWDQLGGGQKVFIALSLKLALSLLIQKRLGIDIKFLELDEVDQPLDEAGVDAYVEVIRKWQSKFKIFVITHNKQLKNKFNHAILVENNEEEGSTAKVVTNW